MLLLLSSARVVFPMDWLSKIMATKRALDGGENSGGGDCRLEIGGSPFGVTTADSDLRWVPPRSWEEMVEKPVRATTYLNDAAAGKIGAVSWPNNSAATTLLIVDGVLAIAPLSIALMKRVAEMDDVDSGAGDGNGAVLPQASDGSLRVLVMKTEGSLLIHIAGGIWRQKGKQRSLQQKVVNARNKEVSSFLNIQKNLHRVDLGLCIQKSRVADFVVGDTWLSIVIYVGVLKSDAVKFICFYTETRGNSRLIRACSSPTSGFNVVIGLVELMWNDFRRNREGMEAHGTNLMVAESFSLFGVVGFVVFYVGLLAGVSMFPFSKARLFVQVRISILSRFSGFIHDVHLWHNMCLFSVNSYTVLITAKHVPVQYVWKLCSSLGRIGVSNPDIQFGCGLIIIIMIIVLLEFLFSGNFIRNHFYMWIPLEAYLAAWWFVKASWTVLTLSIGYFKRRRSLKQVGGLMLETSLGVMLNFSLLVSFLFVSVFSFIVFRLFVWFGVV